MVLVSLSVWSCCPKVGSTWELLLFHAFECHFGNFFPVYLAQRPAEQVGNKRCFHVGYKGFDVFLHLIREPVLDCGFVPYIQPSVRVEAGISAGILCEELGERGNRESADCILRVLVVI